MFIRTSSIRLPPWRKLHKYHFTKSCYMSICRSTLDLMQPLFNHTPYPDQESLVPLCPPCDQQQLSFKFFHPVITYTKLSISFENSGAPYSAKMTIKWYNSHQDSPSQNSLTRSIRSARTCFYIFSITNGETNFLLPVVRLDGDGPMETRRSDFSFA